MYSSLHFSAKGLQQTLRSGSRRGVKWTKHASVATEPFNKCGFIHKRLFSDNGTELRIPTPFGHIAAKEYGQPKGHSVLAVHGWLDNCGTFELLLPHIVEENNLHVVAIDESGCGLSCHLPPGAEYSVWSLVKEIKRVVNYLEWKNFSILAHSRGAVFSIAFAAMFPELVQSVTALDTFGLVYTKENYPYTDKEAVVLNKILSFEDKLLKTPIIDETAPVYTEEEAINRIMTASPFGLIEKTNARILMKRGTKQYKNGLIFTRDLRHKLPVMGPLPSKADVLELVSKVRCDLLVIMATKGPFAQFDTHEWFNIYRSKCRTFKHANVCGKHYIHMDNPEEVASIINPFLNDSILKGPIANREFL